MDPLGFQRAVGDSVSLPFDQQPSLEQEFFSIALAGRFPSSDHDLNDTVSSSVNETPDIDMLPDLTYQDPVHYFDAGLSPNPSYNWSEVLPIGNLLSSKEFPSLGEAIPGPACSSTTGSINTEWFPGADLSPGLRASSRPSIRRSRAVSRSQLALSPICDQDYPVLLGHEEVPSICPVSSSTLLGNISAFDDSVLCLPQLDGGTFCSSPNQSNKSTHANRSCQPDVYGKIMTSARLTSRSRRCIRCRKVGKKCTVVTSAGGSRCSQCAIHDIPASICGQGDNIEQIKAFSKCLRRKYESLSSCSQSSIFNPPRRVQLGLYHNGPILEVECCEFLVTDETDINQISVFVNNLRGWEWMYTTAYRLSDTQVDVSSYIQKCVPFELRDHSKRHKNFGGPRCPISFFVVEARAYEDVPIIQQCFEMLTAFRLIYCGWHFAGSESLGMSTVQNQGSIFYHNLCVPRMLENQLNYALELKMMQLEKKILKGIWKIMRGGRRDWPIGFLAIVILLHVREVDATRIVHFHQLYSDLNRFWTYSTQPCNILDEMIASSNSLLAHFHCSWRQPLYMNWDTQKSKDMVDNDPKVVDTMMAIQDYARKLRNWGLIGRKARDLYRAGDPYNAELTVSSLLFESIKEGCEVKDFY